MTGGRLLWPTCRSTLCLRGGSGMANTRPGPSCRRKGSWRTNSAANLAPLLWRSGHSSERGWPGGSSGKGISRSGRMVIRASRAAPSLAFTCTSAWNNARKRRTRKPPPRSGPRTRISRRFRALICDDVAVSSGRSAELSNYIMMRDPLVRCGTTAPGAASTGTLRTLSPLTSRAPPGKRESAGTSSVWRPRPPDRTRRRRSDRCSSGDAPRSRREREPPFRRLSRSLSNDRPCHTEPADLRVRAAVGALYLAWKRCPAGWAQESGGSGCGRSRCARRPSGHRCRSDHGRRGRVKLAWRL
jgi:hypothetical protein